MGRRYKEPPTPPEWYPAEIHKRVLSLDEWADEIAFRLAVKKDVRERRELMGADSHYHGDMYRDGEAERFVLGVQNKEARHGVSKLGVNMGMPVENVQEKYERWQWSLKDEIDRGLFLPVMINLAYDNKTLIKHFTAHLEEARKSVEREYFGDGLRSTAYGKRLYTEADTVSWFDQKLLDWIDLELWRYLTWASFKQGDIPELIGVSEASVGNTLKVRSGELLSGIGLLRLRASAKYLSGTFPVPGK